MLDDDVFLHHIWPGAPMATLSFVSWVSCHMICIAFAFGVAGHALAGETACIKPLAILADAALGHDLWVARAAAFESIRLRISLRSLVHKGKELFPIAGEDDHQIQTLMPCAAFVFFGFQLFI